MDTKKQKPLFSSWLGEPVDDRCISVKPFCSEWSKNFIRRLVATQKATRDTASKD